MRKRLLNIISNFSVSYTWWMLIVIIIITSLLGYRASNLKIRVGAESLLPGDNPRTKAYNRIIDEFENDANIILLAKGEKDSLIAYADAVKPLLEDFDEWVSNVYTKIPVEYFRKNALKLIPSDQLDNFGSMFYDPNLVPYLINLNNAFESEYQSNDDVLESRREELEAVHFLDRLELFVEIQQEVMDGLSLNDLGQRAVDAITFGEIYMFSPDKDMILIQIEPTFNVFIDPLELQKRINIIDSLIIDVSREFGVTAGLTGTIVLQRDELQAITSDSWTITIIALAGIFILFVISFRMWLSPILAILTVILGVIWALGIASILVDYLSMLTAMISVILVGLGIDFSLHIISGYTEKRNQGHDVKVSIQDTLQRFGPGIMTGGITTGLAFLTLMISETEGMQEMGIVGGSSIIVIMLATIIILPNMLIIRERILKNINKTIPIRDVSYPFLGGIAKFVARNRLVMSMFFILLTIFLFHRGTKMKVDYNILNLEPIGLKSIALQKDLIDAFDLSSDFIMITADSISDARNLADRAREMKTAGWVESISDYIPDSKGLEKQYRFLKDLRRNLKEREVRKQMSSHDMKMYEKEISRLEANIIELQDLAFLGGQDKVYDKAIKLVGEAGDSIPRGSLTKFINSITKELSRVELTYLQQEFSKAFTTTILGMANTQPLTLDNLPKEIKDRFTGKSGNIFIVNVYPEKNIWEDERYLHRFTAEATELSDKATGMPPIFVELLNIMGRDGKKATYVAMIAIFFILLVDFKSLRYAVLGMIPLTFGVIWMIGIMQLLGLQFNMMNMSVITLVLGIGVDDGVHILHRWKIEQNIDIVYRSTGKAILLTSLTTMISFGSLWFSTYRGLGSLGIALFIGVGTCFLATLFMLPPLLTLQIKNR